MSWTIAVIDLQPTSKRNNFVRDHFLSGCSWSFSQDFNLIFLFVNVFNLKKYIYILFLIMYIDTCRVFRGVDMNFCIFFGEILKEVAFSFLSIIEVVTVIQNKTQRAKKIKLLNYMGQKSI